MAIDIHSNCDGAVIHLCLNIARTSMSHEQDRSSGVMKPLFHVKQMSQAHCQGFPQPSAHLEHDL
jgi:hypothetical protein